MTSEPHVNSRTKPLAIGALAALAALVLLATWLLADKPRRGESAQRSELGEQRPSAESRSEAPAPLEHTSESAPAALERVETAATPPDLLVSVVSGGHGRALSMSEVLLLDESGARRWSAWTDENAQCLIPSAARLGAVFVQARSQNHFDAIEPLEPTASEVRLTLELALLPASAEIRGYVTSPDGVAAGAGAAVLLKRGMRDWASVDETRRLLEGETLAGFELTRTDHEGRFAFQVDTNSGPFQLLAANAGLLTPLARNARVGEFVLLPLIRLHGARVRLLDGDSGNGAASASASGALSLDLSHPATTSVESDASLVLAGVTAADLTNEPGAVRFVIHDRAAQAVSGPHTLRIRLPGFEPATLDVRATSLQFGFARHELRLVRTATDFGRLRLHAVDVSPALHDALVGRKLPGSLLLSEADGARVQFACELSLEQPTEVEGVPLGAYQIDFHGAQSFSLSATSSVIVQRTWTDVSFSLGACGAARITLRASGLDAIREPLQCALEWQAGPTSRPHLKAGHWSVTLRPTPTVLAPLLVGGYALLHGRFGQGATSGRAPFVVRAGELSEVEITLGP